MPKEDTELIGFFRYYCENFDAICFLEKLSIRHDDLVSSGKVYHIQKMLANYEHLKAMLEVSEMPYVMVHPLSWQSRLRLRIKGEEKTARKRRYAEIAKAMYPAVKVTLWNADALMILTFGRYILANDLKWLRTNLPSKELSKLLF